MGSKLYCDVENGKFKTKYICQEHERVKNVSLGIPEIPFQEHFLTKLTIYFLSWRAEWFSVLF